MSEFLRLSNICKRVPAGARMLEILRDISMSVARGEFLAITGPSGSGKSTLLNLLGLLEKPTSGSFELLGRPADQLSPSDAAQLRAEHIGFIFQSFHLISHLTVRQNIALPLRYAHRRDAGSAVDALLERFGLRERALDYPATLSGGEKQRVAIARAVINQPEMLLADEPTGALDSQNSRVVLDLLKEFHQHGRSLVMITHDERVAAEADRILRLRDGHWEEAA